MVKPEDIAAVINALCPLLDPDGDPDRDGLTNAEEEALGTDPNNPDTDNDALSDGDEINIHGTDPRDNDSDDDGFTDGEEVLAGANPLDETSFPFTRVSSSPANGETDVAITRETIIRFSHPLAAGTTLSDTVLFAEFGGQPLSAQIHLSPDRKTATLFYDNPLPASARIRVMLIGDTLLDAQGRAVDADGDGVAGGAAFIDFDTLSLTVLPGTQVCGRVFASELIPGDAGMSVNVPLEGVTISVDGLADTLQAVTDAMGDFCLDPAPAGRFFVHIDGRTATNGVPEGAFYPFVGKPFESVPGEVSNVDDIFLPLIVPDTLQPVSETSETMITFPASVEQEFPELAGTQLMVPANSLPKKKTHALLMTACVAVWLA